MNDMTMTMTMTGAVSNTAATAAGAGREPLPPAALDQLFLQARTHNVWLERAIGDDTLRALYDLMKMAPTSTNSNPGRIVFLRTPEAKERLRPALNAGNVDKVMKAPVTAIIAYDLHFYDRLAHLYPMREVRSGFAGDAAHAELTALRNSSLQGAYFLLAARALGLDCGPISGFDNAKVDQEFFGPAPAMAGEIRSNFLCNLGYGDTHALFPRLPRLAFDEACVLL